MLMPPQQQAPSLHCSSAPGAVQVLAVLLLRRPQALPAALAPLPDAFPPCANIANRLGKQLRCLLLRGWGEGSAIAAQKSLRTKVRAACHSGTMSQHNDPTTTRITLKSRPLGRPYTVHLPGESAREEAVELIILPRCNVHALCNVPATDRLLCPWTAAEDEGCRNHQRNPPESSPQELAFPRHWHLEARLQPRSQ